MIRGWLWLFVTTLCLRLPIGCAREADRVRNHRAALSTSVVIAEVYGGGGNSGAPFDHDYVVLFNRGGVPVSLGGLHLQYSSAAGAFQAAAAIVALPNVLLGAGQYYLVELGGTVASNGQPLPTPDLSATIALGSVAGKLVLTATPLDGCGNATNPCDLGGVLDLVGYGVTASMWEGAGAIFGTSNVLSAHRKSGGCEETDDNSLDFELGAPTPETTTSTSQPCVPQDAGTGGASGAAGASGSGGVAASGGAGGASDAGLEDGSSGAAGSSGGSGEGGASGAAGASGASGAAGVTGAAGASGAGGTSTVGGEDASFGRPELRGIRDRNGGCAAATSRSPSMGPLAFLLIAIALRKRRWRPKV